MKRILQIFFGGALACIVLAYAVGLYLPREHTVTIKATFNQPVSELWDTIANFANAPKWNPNLKSAKRQADQNGHEVWREDYDGSVFYFETVESVPNKLLKRKILNDNLPYTGTWTFQLEEVEGKALLSITEDAVVNTPFGRFIGKFIMGHASAIAGYMFAFGKKYDQKLQIEVIWPDA